MKVLHIIWSANFGGIERLVIDLVKFQKTSKQVEPSIFISSKLQGDFSDQIDELEVDIHCGLFNSGFDVSPAKLIKTINWFRKYDCLHFHGFNPAVALCAKIAEKKIIYTEHGNFGFGRHWSLIDRIKDYFKNIFLNNFAHYITYNSNFTKSIAEKRYRISKADCDVVYNGIEHSESENISQNIDRDVLHAIDKKFVVGTTSRFAGFKRIDRLIDGFSKFACGRDTVLLLVGDGPLRNELADKVRQCNVENKTIFAGYRSNVRDYQRLMDVCVFPSENEPFGLVAVETLSLGKPTIVFEDGGGMTEVVGGCSPENIIRSEQHLINRLEYYYNNQIEQSEFTKYTEHSKQFSIEKMGRRFNNVYRTVNV